MKDKQVHEADPGTVLEFLNRVQPFKELEMPEREKLAEKFAIDFYPKGTLVLKQGISTVSHLYLIYRGGVKAYLADADGEESLKDYRGEGGYFGALGIIQDSTAVLNVETVEDTFCFLLDKEIFTDLVKTNPRFASFYLKRFSEDIVGTAYAEMRSQKIQPKAQDGLYLFSADVGDVVKKKLEVIAASDTIQHAADKMARLQIGSLLVRNPSQELVGIITDKDLRTKVVARGLDYRTPVENIMSSPVHTIPSNTMCFDALLHMMNRQVHHLAVQKGDDILGVLTAHDIMVHQGSSPIALFREIQSQRTIGGLYPLAEKVPLIVRTLVQEGAKANNITRMISVLNDQIVDRVLALLEDEVGQPPYPYCWMMFGSEGRQEQTFKTDQDNALIYENPTDEWEQIKAAKLYFRRFGNRAIEHLAKCGYPLCKGEMMASNPRWRKPYSTWRSYFDRWMSAPEPQAVLHATIFFDFRGGHGAGQICERLRDHLVREAPRKGIFLMHLAKDCLTGKPPLTFFRNFMVEKDGQHKNRLDLKTRGLVPFVDFGRIMALRHGIRETNTMSRLQALADQDLIPHELYAETRDAYEFQMHLRLIHQYKMMEAGETPDNYIDPAELSDVEKQTLKEAFGVISRIQSYLKAELSVLD